MRADEVEGVVTGLREIVLDGRRRLRVLGTLLRLTSDEIMPVVAGAVADERRDAIKAASIDASFVADLQSLRVAILTVRGSAAPINGASRAKALRHLLSVAAQPPPCQ